MGAVIHIHPKSTPPKRVYTVHIDSFDDYNAIRQDMENLSVDKMEIQEQLDAAPDEAKAQIKDELDDVSLRYDATALALAEFRKEWRGKVAWTVGVAVACIGAFAYLVRR